MTVERLDFSNLPLGYSKCLHRTGWSLLHGDKEIGFYQARSAIYDLTKDAWAHHKTRHDPPGMNSLGGFFCSPRTKRKAVEARAAAWAWYVDAVEVADLLDTAPARIFDHRGKPVPHYWSNTLMWSADQRAEVRSWLAWHTEAGQRDSRPPTLPEVLRG